MSDPGKKILDQVNFPKDLKKLPIAELNQLVDEIREQVLSAVSESGGHLASSLGVIELTVALHYVFDLPEDKFIWDVGHQCYAHKILTGRKDKFKTIRQYQGLSGFPKREESEFDSFGTGHASTSISAALGMAEAMKLSGKGNKVVAIIGDGGLSGGQALEALNQTPSGLEHSLGNLLVILNDNEMSIGPSVGAISRLLSRAVTGPRAFKFVHFMRKLAKPLPYNVQLWLSNLNRRWRRSLLGLLTPGMLIEAFGYHYIGPIGGHSLEQLIYYLDRAKKIDEPILIHILTKKGKGYTYAEENPEDFHGIGPFNITTGNGKKSSQVPTYTGIFSKTLLRLFSENPKTVGITAAMAQGTGLDLVKAQFPNRVFDLGITEPHCVTFAAGLACEGFRPVVAIYSTFLQRAYDQILHDVCIQKLPVIFCLDRAGIVGEDGPTHQGLFDLSYLRSLPNMAVMAPKDENELQHMLKTALGMDQPVAIRYPRGKGEGVALDLELKSLEIGKAEILRKGSDLTIISIGSCVWPSIKAAEMLAAKGMHAGVVNARFAKPLDHDLILRLAEECKALVTVEENVLAGGFGSGVMELLESAGMDWGKLKRIGIPDQFVEQGAPAKLREIYGLDAQGIFQKIMEFMQSREFSTKAIPGK
jgi:1-deoxy-D-xylulose-5-phosphate synthase